MALAPEGTQQHKEAKELNSQLWQLYQNSAYQSGEATKELKALRKSGAYSA
jgi:tRNA A-37 threonylcarbamoyl transferase component Bud32